MAFTCTVDCEREMAITEILMAMQMLRDGIEQIQDSAKQGERIQFSCEIGSEIRLHVGSKALKYPISCPRAKQ